MFSNAEKKLKSVVRIAFLVLLITNVVGFLIYTFNVISVTDFMNSGDYGIVVIKISWIILGLIITGICIFVCYIISLLILTYLNYLNISRDISNSLESINEKLKTRDVRVSEKGTTESTESIIKYERPKLGEWKCVNCGKVNTNYDGICECGQHRLR